MKMRRVWIIGGGVVLTAIVVFIALTTVIKKNQAPTNITPSSLQNIVWQRYKQQFWNAKTGQTTVDKTTDETTSEAQGYTMLRAVWTGERTTFATTWNWTASHLQRSDKLFSWRWGKQNDGSSGILTGEGGNNTASDADTDIAFALLVAGTRWHDTTYLTAAKAIVPAIWEQEVVSVQGKPYLTADDIEKNSNTLVVNPSYFAPYAYRIFAQLDPVHTWMQLVSQSYETLPASSQQQLGSSKSANLPPDWITIDRNGGQLMPDGTNGHDTNFGYDAFRTVWRTALDYQWNHDATAKSTLASFSSLVDFWNQTQKLYAIYGHDGTPVANYESPAMYGGTLGYFAIIQPQIATQIYQRHIAPLYDASKHQLSSSVGYYENNWLWFGLALYNNQLPKPTTPVGTAQ